MRRCRREPGEGRGPVHRAGEGVEAGEALEFALGRDLGVDYAHGGDEAIGVSIGVEEDLGVHLEPVVAAVMGAQAATLHDGLACLDSGKDCLVRRHVLRVEDVRQLDANPLVRIASERRGYGVGHPDDGVVAQAHHNVGGVVG